MPSLTPNVEKIGSSRSESIKTQMKLALDGLYNLRGVDFVRKRYISDFLNRSKVEEYRNKVAAKANLHVAS